MSPDWQFDIPSALLVGALLTLLIGLVLMAVARSVPDAVRPAVRWWVVATLVQPAGFVLITLRGGAPAWATVVLANALIAFAFVAYALALHRFFGSRARPAPLLAPWLVVVAGSVWWGLLVPDLTARLVVVSLAMAAILAYGARTLYRHAHRRDRLHHVVGLSFAAAGGILAYRAGVLLVDPARVTGVFTLNHVQILTYAVGGILPVVATVGFLLMGNERSARELERAARVDYLTDCYNRRAIEELGARMMAAARRHGMSLAVLVIDLDHFKRINDELGHAAGDEALVRSVERIRDCLRADDLLGRLGGEEFVVLMPNTDSASAVAAAERIRENFNALPLVLGDVLRPVTLSIGVAVLAPADRLFSQLLQRGDRAMYAAKNAGRNLVIADPMSGWVDTRP
ncbi:GGDEF domain-containing protein [Arenimonas fontis]|uniref:diguanylate cyclase n=1 Tax=Arenimonas fontis TaxID=2608255 RepID=A0A5B2ZA88_9GAMM|nr:GGDEF domain-containing protein [Arenimonas fontis]KAA2284062.1 GGDEF domain-containing protein [Arenimonas fontis]